MNITTLMRNIAEKAAEMEIERKRQDHALLVELQNMMATMIAGSSNDNGAPPPPALPVAAASPKRQPYRPSNGVKKVTDDQLIAALTSTYQSPKQIVAKLAKAGIIVSKASIYARMPDLADANEAIEEQANPMAWRLVGKRAGDAAVKAPKVGQKPSTTVSKASGKVIAPRAANDPGEALTEGLHHGDCLDLMPLIPDKFVRFICVDGPYATCGARDPDGNPIDDPLDQEKVWEQYRRIMTDDGVIALFGSQPYTTDLINAGRDWFKYSLVWEKDRATGFNHARNQPMKSHEDILIFSPANMGHARKVGTSGTTDNRMTFNPWQAKPVAKANNPRRNAHARYTRNIKAYAGYHEYEGLENCPRSVLKYPKEKRPAGQSHPYAKPVALIDDLIRMYSNEGDVVLDHCIGGGSTAIAAIGADRRWTGIEQSLYYFEMAERRIAEALANKAA